jgi:hypothetical protein
MVVVTGDGCCFGALVLWNLFLLQQALLGFGDGEARTAARLWVALVVAWWSIDPFV